MTCIEILKVKSKSTGFEVIFLKYEILT